MPNWVINVLKFDGPENDVNTLLDFIGANKETGDCDFDFNKFIPMPSDLQMDQGSMTDEAIASILYAIMHDPIVNLHIQCPKAERLKQQNNKSLQELGLKYISNKIQYGHFTWYGWCTENWGTKWNACESFYDGTAVIFETAWAAPVPVLKNMSSRFPTIEITHGFADESIGDGCGIDVYRNGKIIESMAFNGTTEARRFAEDLWANEKGADEE